MLKPALRLLFLALILTFSGNVPGWDYGAPVTASVWNHAGSRLECILEHTIPGLGSALFSRTAGEPAVFRLLVDRPWPGGGRLDLTLLPPSWKATDALDRLGNHAYESGGRPVEIAGEPAEAMIDALEQGREPSLRVEAWREPGEYDDIRLSVVNVAQALEQYRLCVKDLLPVGRKDVDGRIVFFDLEKVEIGSAGRARLDKLAEYLNLDPTLPRLVIANANANTGLDPLNVLPDLFRQRAEAIRTHLADRGLNADRVDFDAAAGSDEKRLAIYVFGPDELLRVHFAFRIFTLDDTARAVLDQLVRYLAVRPLAKPIALEGHTDHVGSYSDNRLLSQRRADTVRGYLISKGILPESLVSRWFGETKPVAENDSEADRRLNRRVEIRLPRP